MPYFDLEVSVAYLMDSISSDVCICNFVGF